MCRIVYTGMNKIYYGEQTKQAIENFPFPVPMMSLKLVYAIAEVKEAAALANKKAGLLDVTRTKAIVKAAQDIQSGALDDQFVTPSIQGGAGTSLHMNVNEVIAARANEFLRRAKSKMTVHPNDHVNMGQSTNDVNPTALRITLIRLVYQMLRNLDMVQTAFHHQAESYKGVAKLGRTHIQDAVPTTVAAEFQTYADLLARHRKRIELAISYLYEMNLGGTAIGNGINAAEAYQEAVYSELQRITKLPIYSAKNRMCGTGSAQDFCLMSSSIMQLSLELSKIANDLRFLASGPKGGIGEIKLAALQPGSSIMPGKVNPVMPESINQIYFAISGKNHTVHLAAEASHLELAVMFPVLASSLIEAVELLTAGMQVFAEKCISTLVVNKERCRELLEQSTAYATFLTPVLGYDAVSDAVKVALRSGKTLRHVLIESGKIDEKTLDIHLSSL